MFIIRLFFVIQLNFLLANDLLASSDDYYAFDAKFGAPLVKYINYPVCKYTDNQCRRWGIAAEIPVNHRPKSSIDSQYVERLHAGGVNFIRFNSIDTKRNKIFSTWAKNKVQRAEQLLQPMDNLIPSLAAKNIQYALSANDFAAKAAITGALKNGQKSAFKQYKISQMTFPLAIELSQKWLKWIYSREVKGQKFSYGQDLGNRYITLVGEDSIYAGYFRDKGRFIDDYTARKLEKCISGKENSIFYSLPHKSKLLRNIEVAEKVAKCLAALEGNYYQQLLSSELKALLPKNIATSNSWYGLGYLLNCYERGDFIDTHAYFDHVVYDRKQNGRVEMVRNRSIIAEPGGQAHGQVNLIRPNLISMFSSAVEGKPLFISEWNHPFWSDYAYEGPLLMTVYASFQNYPLLTMHTLMAWNDDKSKPFSTHGFSVHGNQIMQALNPTLSLVYRRGDIDSSKNKKKINVVGKSQSFIQEMFKTGLDPSKLSAGFEQGLMRGIRLQFNGDTELINNSATWEGNEIKTDNGQIVWRYGNNNASFIVNTPKFKAIAGELKNSESASNLSVSASSHGAVLVVSVDGETIEQSSSILLTIISSQKTSGMEIEWVKKRGFNYPLKAVVNHGAEKVLLKKIEANISLLNMSGKSYRLFAINDLGLESDLGIISNRENKLGFKIGANNTPWYRLVRIY